MVVELNHDFQPVPLPAVTRRHQRPLVSIRRVLLAPVGHWSTALGNQSVLLARFWVAAGDRYGCVDKPRFSACSASCRHSATPEAISMY